MKAIHAPGEEALNYIIEKDGKRSLYTCDTGFYEERTWEFLAGKKVDLVISECTEGPNRSEYRYHMGFPNVLDFKKRAEEVGLTNSDTSWVLTHFSHGGGLMHHELEELVRTGGFEVAWDGMELELRGLVWRTSYTRSHYTFIGTKGKLLTPKSFDLNPADEFLQQKL